MSTLNLNNHEPLCPIFNKVVTAVACDAMPNGWRVMPNAPDTLPSLVQYYRQHNYIAVEMTGSGGCTMGIPEQHYAFRAWHDLLHVQNCGTFDVEGETVLSRMHQAAIFNKYGFNACTLWFAALVEIEIVGQNVVNENKGRYPLDPRAFAVCWLNEAGIERPNEQLKRMEHMLTTNKGA